MAAKSSSSCGDNLEDLRVLGFSEMVKNMDEKSKKQLEVLKLENVEETHVELGRGAYGVVMELMMNGLK